ncbi:MAG TPA: penicillin-binding protein 2 [Micrococcaceae bacterium]
MLALLLVISGKLFLVQGMDVGGMAEAATAQLSQSEVLPAVRGKILDANGHVMAQSVLSYNITVSPKNFNAPGDKFERLDADGHRQTFDRASAVQQLADALGKKTGELTSPLSGDGTFAMLAKDVPPATEEKVMALGLPGIYNVPEQQREYPLGAVGGSVVGFLGAAGTALGGIEQTMDSKLRGTDGERTYQQGRNGIVIPNAPSTTTAAKDGETVQLTLNQDIQYYAQQAAEQQKQQYGADWANIVVIQVKTGKVIALADSSSVDPNHVGASKPEDLGARAVTAAIEPGSTEKTVTAAGAIQEGIVAPDTHLLIPPTYTVDGQTFQDAFAHGTEQRTFAGVIGDSLNTGTVMVGEKLTRQQRYDYLRKFGIGQKTGIPLPGESPGILAKPAQWDVRQQYTVLFGQGVAQTPLQTAMIYQTIANNGVRLEPQLVESYIDPDGTVHKVPQQPGTEVVSPQTSQQVKDMLESVTTIGDATNVKIPGYRVGGKTGTAESPGGGYTSSFVGMAPMENPQYVVLVTVQHPKSNIYGVNQGPTFNDVMGQVLRTYNVPPSTTPSVKLPQYY